jgi:hypothetical protein
LKYYHNQATTFPCWQSYWLFVFPFRGTTYQTSQTSSTLLVTSTSQSPPSVAQGFKFQINYVIHCTITLPENSHYPSKSIEPFIPSMSLLFTLPGQFMAYHDLSGILIKLWLKATRALRFGQLSSAHILHIKAKNHVFEGTSALIELLCPALGPQSEFH